MAVSMLTEQLHCRIDTDVPPGETQAMQQELRTAARELERPLRRDAERNRARILAAASALFVEQGLDVGVDEIARRAGVGMGTLYRRFPNKDALIEAILGTVIDRLRSMAMECLANDPPDEALRNFLLRAMTADTCQQAFLSHRLWTGRTNDLMHAEVVPAMAMMFANAQAVGTIRSDATLVDLLVLMRSLRTAIDVMAGREADAWHRFLDIVLDGLRPCSSHRPLPPASLTLNQLRTTRAVGPTDPV